MKILLTSLFLFLSISLSAQIAVVVDSCGVEKSYKFTTKQLNIYCTYKYCIKPAEIWSERWLCNRHYKLIKRKRT